MIKNPTKLRNVLVQGIHAQKFAVGETKTQNGGKE